MGTLIIKYPNFKGFFAIFHIFGSLIFSFLNSTVSTSFLSRGYNNKSYFKLFPYNYLLSLKDV